MCVWVYGDYCWKAESRKKQEKLFPSLSEYLYVYLSGCISDVCFSANVSLSAWEKKARALLEANFELPEGKRPPALLSVCSLRGRSRAESAAEKKEQD